MSDIIRGTVKELVAKKLTIGGQPIDAPTLYILSRFGVARKVDEVKSSPTSRRASAVWEVPREIELKLTATAE
jgi:hypothetical protein